VHFNRDDSHYLVFKKIPALANYNHMIRTTPNFSYQALHLIFSSRHRRRRHAVVIRATLPSFEADWMRRGNMRN
jgi:hypothetical protein